MKKTWDAHSHSFLFSAGTLVVIGIGGMEWKGLNNYAHERPHSVKRCRRNCQDHFGIIFVATRKSIADTRPPARESCVVQRKEYAGR